MVAFPPSPIPPSEFMEEFVPRAFTENDALRDSIKDLDTRLGVKLDGDGGGEWVVHVQQGAVRVAREPRSDAAFSVIQSVADWRGCLWEGRGGAIGKGAASMFKPGDAAQAGPPGMGGPPSPAALAQMNALDGLMRMVVSGGEGGDWAVDFKLGPGDIPDAPTTTITISAEDADAMERGELNPMEAFMAGRIRVEGDMALMMQMQAIQMQVQMQAAQAAGGSGSSGGGAGS